MKNKIDKIVKRCIAKDIIDKYTFEQLSSGGYSAKIFNNVLLLIDTSIKKSYRIIFRDNDNLEKFFPSDIDFIKKFDKDNMVSYQIDVEKNEKSLIDILNKLSAVIKQQQEYIFIKHPAELTFGCCSHYNECSDLKYCIMYDTNREFYKGCSYKTNLESGKIFYGKNSKQ